MDAIFQVKRSIQGIREQMLKEIKNELIDSSPVFKHDDFKRNMLFPRNIMLNNCISQKCIENSIEKRSLKII